MKTTVIGGANVDITGMSAVPLQERDSNPAKVHLSGGGVARNIACNLARLGMEVTFVSGIGDDGFGKLLRESLAESGLDDSALIVRQGLTTGLYLVLLEPTGEMFIAVNDMTAVESLRPADMEALGETIAVSDLVVVDANLRVETLKALARTAVSRGVPLMADAVSVSKAGRLLPLLPNLALLKANRAEAAALAGFPLDTDEALEEGCRILLGKGIGQVYITLGEQGSCCASGPDGGFFKQPRLAAKIVNVNGAGDAFAAGAAYRFC
ncbi:MAG: PfkB family carbohydrate kinase, partial [Treponema sp.]|nr:PfkB family carbohydrate kinase [Treponema sp.]